MMILWKKSVILLTASFIFGCGGKSGLPDFPADYVYSVRPFENKCSKHKIIKKDPVVVEKGIYVDMRECESVFGFAAEDTGPVFNWIRNAQAVAKKRCK